jgi:hypothetical protein
MHDIGLNPTNPERDFNWVDAIRGENRYEQSYYPTGTATPRRRTSRLPAAGTID